MGGINELKGRSLNALRRWWEFRDLLINLVSKEIKVRYQGAVLGFAWSLMNPLMVTLMYLFLFSVIFKSNQEHHALFMITGIIHWNLFSSIVLQAPELLVSNSGLLKKVYFPRLLIPVSNVLVNLVLWGMALTVFAALYFPLGGSASAALMIYPLYLALLVTFAFGVALILCVAYVEFHDLKHLVEVVVQLLFWGTPIIYPLSMVPEQIRWIFMVNPLTEFAVIFQTIFWAGEVPSIGVSLAFSAWAVGLLYYGLRLFYRRGAFLIERL